MFNFFRPSPPPDRAALLAALPQRNTLAHESARTPTSLRLTAPLRPSGFRAFLSKAPTEKSFDLDQLGLWTWDHLDGRTTIAALIQNFATAHRLNLREAEVSLLAFLKTLTQRNLIALTAPKINHDATTARRKRKKK
jgi:hypothetical protein